MTEPDQDVVERFRNELVRPVSFAPVTFLPPVLYHYTTAAGFAGILNDKAIRATNFSFLNDPSELQYGRTLVDEIIAQGRFRLAKTRRGFFQEVANRFNVEVVSEVYVCCFTRLEDDLSQWRSYGSSAVERYALGFDSDFLQQIDRCVDAARFSRVLYKEDEQRDRLDFVVERVANFIEREQPNGDDMENLAAYTAKHLARLLPILKNPAYEREDEWRIILWQAPDSSAPKFDTSRGVLRPFMNVDLATPLPLLDVYIMAPTRREITMKAARLLLQSVDLAETAVYHSSIPFAE